MSKLILDKETDFVWFSPYIRSYKFWAQMEKELTGHNIGFSYIPNTTDIWARDYMPVQTTDGFVQYLYWPDYLTKRVSDRQYITNSIASFFSMTGRLPIGMPLILDGGNIIKTPDHVILTDKIFKENDKDRDEIIGILKELFGVEPVIIPWDKAEKYGHADGMVRYVDGNTVLITNYGDFDTGFRDKLVDSLSPHFDIKELHYDVDKPNKNNWAYINFLQVGSTIFMPALGAEEDDQAQQQLSDIYHCTVRPVLCESLIKQGGALNCISWNVKYQPEVFKKRPNPL